MVGKNGQGGEEGLGGPSNLSLGGAVFLERQGGPRHFGYLGMIDVEPPGCPKALWSYARERWWQSPGAERKAQKTGREGEGAAQGSLRQPPGLAR